MYYYRQKVPVDLRTVFGKAEAIRSLRAKDPEVAKGRHADEVLKQAKVWQSLRARAEVSARFIPFPETGRRRPSLSDLAAISDG